MRQKKGRPIGKAKRGATDIEAPELGHDSLYQFPDLVIRRLLSGQHPLKVIREYRGVTVEALADGIHVPPSLLADIECDRQVFAEDLRLAAAKLLSVDARALVRLVKGDGKLKPGKSDFGCAAAPNEARLLGEPAPEAGVLASKPDPSPTSGSA